MIPGICLMILSSWCHSKDVRISDVQMMKSLSSLNLKLFYSSKNHRLSVGHGQSYASFNQLQVNEQRRVTFCRPLVNVIQEPFRVSSKPQLSGLFTYYIALLSSHSLRGTKQSLLRQVQHAKSALYSIEIALCRAWRYFIIPSFGRSEEGWSSEA